MLFNSLEFLFVFLPVTLIAWLIAASRGRGDAARIVLLVASLAFYGYWSLPYLLLLLLSIGFNWLMAARIAAAGPEALRTLLLTAGVAGNLAVLGFYKYAGFFVANLNMAAGLSFSIPAVVLPLAISFYTFQQIAYLVDVRRRLVAPSGLVEYALFVSFFPQLIAGPIVHHKEMVPQLRAALRLPPSDVLTGNLALGLSVFMAGLFKKVVLADSVAVYATPVFAAADQGLSVTTAEAWGGALAYSFQLYFDFSGYSDMAIGLGLMFGIRLPQNFDSPYKAASIIDFWRRWHMTLSRFLRDYLYIPLGGSRNGSVARYRNLFLTMLLGGMWHGAGWNFILWGALHGAFLVINHGWNALTGRADTGPSTRFRAGHVLTFLAVVMAWVPFRAGTLEGAVSLWRSMLMLDGLILPEAVRLAAPGLAATLAGMGVQFGGFYAVDLVDWATGGVPLILALALIAFLMPNVHQIFADGLHPGRLRFRLSPGWAVTIGLFATVSVTYLNRVSEFLYFQF